VHLHFHKMTKWKVKNVKSHQSSPKILRFLPFILKRLHDVVTTYSWAKTYVCYPVDWFCNMLSEIRELFCSKVLRTVRSNVILGTCFARHRSHLHLTIGIWVVIFCRNVITTSCNHARSVNFTALLFYHHSPWWKPTVSWLKRRCSFQKRFTTVEHRVIIAILLNVSAICLLKLKTVWFSSFENRTIVSQHCDLHC